MGGFRGGEYVDGLVVLESRRGLLLVLLSREREEGRRFREGEGERGGSSMGSWSGITTAEEIMVDDIIGAMI